MSETEKTRPRFAVAEACFRCGDPIVKMQEYSEDNEHGGAPITALIEKHWVTPHGALCLKCYKWYVSKWWEHRMAKDWLS
jgi:hypothetical protein